MVMFLVCGGAKNRGRLSDEDYRLMAVLHRQSVARTLLAAYSLG
jgi:hypothetical protein